jgi:hypothetical protein
MLPEKSQSETRYEHAVDRVRNERQKCMLLTEVARILGPRVGGKLCEESAVLIARSKYLCERAGARKEEIKARLFLRKR